MTFEWGKRRLRALFGRRPAAAAAAAAAAADADADAPSPPSPPGVPAVKRANTAAHLGARRQRKAPPPQRANSSMGVSASSWRQSGGVGDRAADARAANSAADSAPADARAASLPSLVPPEALGRVKRPRCPSGLVLDRRRTELRVVDVARDGDCGFQCIARACNGFDGGRILKADDVRAIMSDCAREAPVKLQKLIAKASMGSTQPPMKLQEYSWQVLQNGLEGHWLGSAYGFAEIILAARALNVNIQLYTPGRKHKRTGMPIVRRYETARGCSSSERSQRVVRLLFQGHSSAGHFALLVPTGRHFRRDTEENDMEDLDTFPLNVDMYLADNNEGVTMPPLVAKLEGRLPPMSPVTSASSDNSMDNEVA